MAYSYKLQSEGERFGSSVGEIFPQIAKGLSEEHYTTKDILKQLAHDKTLEKQARHLSKLTGRPFEEIQSIVHQPEWLQKGLAAGGYYNSPMQQMQGQDTQQQKQITALDRLNQLTNNPELREKLAALNPQAQEALLGRLAEHPQLGKQIKAQMQQPQQQQPMNQPYGQGFGNSLQAGLQKGGPKAGLKAAADAKAATLAPEDKTYYQTVQKDAKYASDIKPILDEIRSILDEGDINTGFEQALTAKIDPSLLGQKEQYLHNKLQAALTLMTNVQSQGRGSDLLRKIIQEGKMSIGQDKNTLEQVLNDLDEDRAKKTARSYAVEDVLLSAPGVVRKLDNKVESLIMAQENRLKHMPEEKQVEYILKNPHQLRHIREFELETKDGVKQWYRDENDNWVEVE